MAIQHTITKLWQGNTGGIGLSTAVILNGVEEINQQFTLANGSSNVQYPFNFTKANLQSLFITSTGNITMLTNSTSTPADTISINGSDAYQWDVSSGVPCPLATSTYTNAYYSNSSGASVTVNIRVLTND